MTNGQLFLTLIISLVLVQTIIVFRKKKFTSLFKFFWVLIWVAVLVIVWWPNLLVSAAEKVGIGRGADLIVYLAIITIFYICFRLFAKNQELEQNITKLARKIALLENKECLKK